MTSKYQEVDPNLIWQKGIKAEDVKMFSGGDQIKPWSNLRELPEFSYKTSYQIGFPHHYTFEKFFEPPAKLELPKQEERHKFEVYKNQYTTTTGSAYVIKNVKPEPGEKPSFLDYLDTLRDRFQKKMCVIPFLSSEYCTNYKVHHFDPKLCGGVHKDQRSETICEAPKLAKEMQPLFEPSDGGARREKDIYKSQTHYAHHYIPPRKVCQATESLGVPESGIKVYSNPNPLDPFMKTPFRQVTLRKKTLTVPHRGMITEFQENYQPPLDMFTVNDIELKEELSSVMKVIDREAMIKEMDMFHTEYNHLGSDWNTQNI